MNKKNKHSIWICMHQSVFTEFDLLRDVRIERIEILVNLVWTIIFEKYRHTYLLSLVKSTIKILGSIY